MNNIVLISNNKSMQTLLEEKGALHECHLVKSITTKSEVMNTLDEILKSGLSVDTVVVSEGLDTDPSIMTWELLLKIHMSYPVLRIVYLSGDIDMEDSDVVSILMRLIDAGITNIVSGSHVNEAEFFDAITSDKTKNETIQALGLESYDSDYFDRTEGYNQVVLFSSMKPGSGKTFLAVNTAIAIAKYGQMKRLENNTMVKPRVAIIDGDLLNLNVGTLLRVNNKNSNMMTALANIQQYVSPDGRYSMDDETLENLTKVIRRCLVAHKQIDNLYCMVAPQMNLDVLSTLTPAQFYFMMERLLKAFDVIICDSNSSFDHVSTAPLFEMASRAYMLCDIDYNNICNNARYNATLVSMGYGQKLHYVLNKDIPYDVAPTCLYDVAYTGDEFQKNGILVDYRIPLVDANVMKKLDYEAVPLILDTSDDTKAAREAILELANDIWAIDMKADQGSSVKKAVNKHGKKLEQAVDTIGEMINN